MVMPLFGWRKRKEQTSKRAEVLPNTTANSSSPPATSTSAQVVLKGLSENEAKTQEEGNDLAKDVCQPHVTISKKSGKHMLKTLKM